MLAKFVLILAVACTFCVAAPANEPLTPCKFEWMNSSNTIYSCKTTGHYCIPKYPESYVSGESLAPTLRIEDDNRNCALCLPSCCESLNPTALSRNSDPPECKDFLTTFGFREDRPKPLPCPELVERDGRRYQCIATACDCRPELAHVQYQYLVKYVSDHDILQDISVCKLCLPSCCREIPAGQNSKVPANATCVDYLELFDSKPIRRTGQELYHVAPVGPYHRISNLHLIHNDNVHFICDVEIINGMKYTRCIKHIILDDIVHLGHAIICPPRHKVNSGMCVSPKRI